MENSNTNTAPSGVETSTNNEAKTAKKRAQASQPASNKLEQEATKLQGTQTSEPAKVDEPVKVDAIRAANEKAFTSIQGIGLDALDKLFVVMFLAFQERMKALKEILGADFNEADFWANDDIAKSVINGATLEADGYKSDGQPKFKKNQLNAKMAALIAPFIVGLGIRTTEQFNALLATRKGNNLSRLAEDAYSYSKVLSIIPQLSKVGLLTSAMSGVFTYARNQFKSEVSAELALKHVCEYAKADCDIDKMKENKLSLDEVKTVQTAIKAYNTQLKESKTDKTIKAPEKLTWETVLNPIKATAETPAAQPDLTLVAKAS